MHSAVRRYAVYEKNVSLLPLLQAASVSVINGPRFLGKSERYGGVAPRKAADLLILDHNPLIDISATRQIRGVVLKGRHFDRAALDQMLKNAREQVAKGERA